MKYQLLGLCLALTCVSSLAAQTPPGSAVNRDPVQPAAHTSGHASCPEACAPKICVPECGVKKVSRVVYSSKCIEYCLPKCRLGGSCDGCDTCNADCGKPRVKNVLLKKVVTEECPITICVVRDAPACTATSPAIIVAPSKDKK
jgi:hypothetical protein